MDEFDSWRAQKAFCAAFESNPTDEWRNVYEEYNREMTQAEVWMVGAERYFTTGGSRATSEVRHQATQRPSAARPGPEDHPPAPRHR